MTPEARHHTSGSLGLAIALALAAGFVDAFLYLHVTPVFVANMSGNLIRLGIAAGASRWGAVAASGVALAGFLTGVTTATSHLDTRVRRDLAPRSVELLLLEGGLLVTLAAFLLATHVTFSPVARRIDYLPILWGSAAMGIQAVALRRVGQVAVSTTYGTGAIVRLGEKLALALRRTERAGDHRRRVTIAVLVTVLASYVGGAGLASALGGSMALLFLPAAVPLVAGIVLHRRTRATPVDRA